jgi:hypothetical protein
VTHDARGTLAFREANRREIATLRASIAERAERELLVEVDDYQPTPRRSAAPRRDVNETEEMMQRKQESDAQWNAWGRALIAEAVARERATLIAGIGQALSELRQQMREEIDALRREVEVSRSYDNITKIGGRDAA